MRPMTERDGGDDRRADPDRDATGDDRSAGTDLATLSDPRVRPARPTDAERIRALQSFLRQPSPDLLEYGLAVGTGFVSGADGDVVGYALPVDSPTRSGCHLAELVVDPAFRREGRARGLLAAVVRSTDGPVTLQAHPDNDAALALYADAGFAIVDEREDAYADGDALVLRRE